MDDLKRVLVFIPAFNEEQMIGEIIDRLQQLYSDDQAEEKGFKVELLVVEDGSTDGTEAVVRSRGIPIISHPKNLGLGAATRTAMEASYGMGVDVALKFDADSQYLPEDLENVIRPILEDKADICWGSRFRGKINYKMPLIRVAGNYFFTWLMNKLTDYEISDAQTGLMAFNRKYLKIFNIIGNYNPPQQLLMDANHKRMRFIEVPIRFNARTTGESFVSYKYPFYALFNLFRVVVYANPLKIFSFIGISFIILALIYFLLWKFMMDYIEEEFFITNLALVLVLLGVQSLFFGIIADLIVKIKTWK